jgi:Ca2+-transporting ATPase
MGSSRNGLSIGEAMHRLDQYGKNELAEKEETPLILQYFEKYTDPMIILLLISAAISIVMQQIEDAVSIILAVVIVSTVGFVQEYKSEQSVDALKDFIAYHSAVKRDGRECDVLSVEVVPGDILVLAQGSRVPADARLIEANDFCVDESILTGESHPVKKQTAPLGEHDGWHVADRDNMVFMGTIVSSGSGLAVVGFTGERTELGKISKMLTIEDKKTPLQENMDEFGKQLSLVSIIAIVVIALIGVLQGKPLKQMFNIAVSLIVAAIPEGLPIAVTLTLALGVRRMAEKNAIVRKLPAVESLGATSVICVDKTVT